MISVEGLNQAVGRSVDPAIYAALAKHVPAKGVDTRLRMIHFLAQAAHETDRFRALTEYASGKAYEGRHDLGNVEPGEGVRFKGRGIFQTTGRANYARAQGALGIPCLAQPELLAEPGNAVLAACLYWNDHQLNDWADRDDGVAISRAINRGNPKATRPANGEAERLALITRLKAAWPDTAG